MTHFAHVGGSDSEEVILMVATHLVQEKEKLSYLDIGCSNHMTGNKNGFIKLEESMRRSIIFIDNSIVTSEGTVNIFVKKKNGEEEIICDVLYSMVSNLINLGQCLDKDYKIMLEEREPGVFDESSKLILKASLSTNKTFKIMINMLDHQCLALTIVGG